MSEFALKHRRVHNILLIQRLLSLREGSSPFTLLLDSLQQSGKPLVREYIQRAKGNGVAVVFVSFETLQLPLGVNITVKARRKDILALQKEIVQATAKFQSTSKVSSDPTSEKLTHQLENLLVIDTLQPLTSNPSADLPAFLSSLITPSTSLLATYHLDVPLPPSNSPYSPTPLTLLGFLATTILTTHALHHILARKRAAEKSAAEPVFGLAEDVEGVLVGKGSNDPQGLVLEMEYRRKSGRSIEEWFYLPTAALSTTAGEQRREKAILLEDHPLFRPQQAVESTDEGKGLGKSDATFSLGLTEKQRRDREGVVLPYFDAQREGGTGEGGRILYDMGVEDDFDEEEDEI